MPLRTMCQNVEPRDIALPLKRGSDLFNAVAVGVKHDHLNVRTKRRSQRFRFVDRGVNDHNLRAA